MLIETTEQLIHVSRYIHLNPVASFLVEPDALETYAWSSYKEYMEPSKNGIVTTSPVMSMFHSVDDYRGFVLDQASYSRELEKIKHLTFE